MQVRLKRFFAYFLEKNVIRLIFNTIKLKNYAFSNFEYGF